MDLGWDHPHLLVGMIPICGEDGELLSVSLIFCHT